MRVDYHVHALGHLEYTHSQNHLRDIFQAAEKAGLQEIGLADHDEYADHFQLSVIRKTAADFPALQVRQGVEVDYRPERETEIRRLLSSFPYDYAIGSVHSVDEWPFDHPDYRDGYHRWDVDELYKAYYEAVAQAAQSGLFDIIGHLDLIKVFGFRPVRNRISLAQPALESIRDNGLCVEINSNGWYKPVQEVYPEETLIAVCIDMGIPLTTGSDAHSPQHVGRDLNRIEDLLCRLGAGTLTVFQKRSPRSVGIGPE